MSKFWNFKNKGDVVELSIDGDLIDTNSEFLLWWFGGKSPNNFRKELKEYAGKDIQVRINSYGGDVFAGVGMYDALMEHRQTGGKVKTYGEKVYSAAVMPFLAGDEREMSPGGMLMVHNPLCGVFGYADDLRKQADTLDKVKDNILSIYVQATGLDKDHLSDLMDKETEMTPQEAVDEGLATGIMDFGITNSAKNVANYHAIVNSANIASAGLMKYIELSKVDRKETNMADKVVFKDTEELRKAYPALVEEIENAAKTAGTAAVDEAVKAERERMIALDALNDGSEAVKKIVDHAKSEGKTADEISFYVDTIKEAKPKDAETSNYVDQAIQDFANSGADGVKPVPHEAENKKSEDKECESISNAFGVVMKGEK